MTETLRQNLSRISWSKNLADFLKDYEEGSKLLPFMERIAVWAANFESADEGNPALSFVREMQISSMNSIMLISAGLYKPAASAIRTLFEVGLYYSYFRTHPVELSSLARSDRYYVDKSELIKFHKDHTPDFDAKQHALGFCSSLEKWYKKVSSIIHGQIPGAWVTYTSIGDVKFDGSICKEAAAAFGECENLLRILFLVTVAQESWAHFDAGSKKMLLKGLSGQQKTIIKLDSA